ncbi:MAG: TonB-dependent receptor family protein [Akkermansiaceae bacterium]
MTKTIALTVLSLGNLAAINAVADDGELSPLTVVGGKDRALELVGSAAYLNTEDLRQQNYTNINRLLARVPGVYTREEDGYGLFPNLSIRGNLGTRSEKTTIMEDGILMAPAPYSAPGAYYSPNAGRMDGIEILKGSSQVKYGPHTTGGVINYLSTTIPEEETFFGRFTFGSDNTLMGHAYYGNTVDTDKGRVGYLLEMHYQSTDGFRSIQGRGGLSTGFERIEPMLKLFWEPDTALKQRFEFKVGYTDFDADESYLGLSERDVRRNPHDRYAATQFDNIDTFQTRTYLKWTAEPSDVFKLEATAYYNRFNRNWYKIDRVSTNAMPGADARGRIATGRTSLHTALLSPGHLGVLQGSAPGSIGVKANNRDYYSYGLQFAGQYEVTTGNVDHTITSGIRLHRDRVRRAQWVDIYGGDGAGNFNVLRNGIRGEEANRRQQTDAIAVFVEDSMKMGKLTLRPGLRFEHMDYEFEDFRTNTSRNDDLSVWSGGLGFTYELCDTDTLFGGIYRGVSTPGPSGYTNPNPVDQTDEETSLAYELGWRYNNADRNLGFELVGFYTDFDNLLAPATGVAQNSPANGGSAKVYGAEAQVNYDPASATGKAYRLPMYVSATWTRATLTSNNAADSGNIFTDFQGGSTKGNDIPYIPEWKIAAGVGVDMEKWGANLDATWTSSMYGTAGNHSDPITSSREGKVDSAVQVDLSGWYQLDENWKLIGGIYNIFDEEDIVSRLPEGPRSGRGRHLYAGFEVQF